MLIILAIKNTPRKRRWAYLAFLFLDFVAAEVLLGLGEDNVLAKYWIVLTEAEFVRGVHGVLLRIVKANTRFLRN